MSKVKLAVVCSHPVQYYSPVFRILAKSADLEPCVFYTWSQSANGPVFDPDFGASFSWDVPLLEGYCHRFVENTARSPTSSSFFGIRTPGLVREIACWEADAVLVYGWCLHSHLIALRKFNGRIPVLFRGDSTLLDPVKPLRALARRWCLRWVYSHVDMAIAVGQNNADYYRWCGIPPERITLAPHSVDTTRFADPTGEHAQRAAAWRLQLGIAPEAIVFVFAGKFIGKKDPLLLLDAFLALDAPAHLVFVGSGELEGKLREGARGRSNVHFLPFQNQSAMPAVYRLADLFVLPSRGPGETWGLALNEAMASGRAVIAGSRVGGARDLVDNGTTGWVFESGNCANLINVLRTALALGRDALLRIGEAARVAGQRFSTEEAAKGIELAALSMVSTAHPPP